MAELCLVGYGSFIDPENVAGRFRYKSWELVWVDGYQRFMGAVDLTKGKKILNREGELVERGVGVSTIEPSEPHRFVATLYRGIPEVDMAAHDERERCSHRFSSLTICPQYISRLDGSNLSIDGEVRAYHADADAIIDGKHFRIVRDDILPDQNHLEKCRKAAAVHGEDVARAFEETTFFADRATPLTDEFLYRQVEDALEEMLRRGVARRMAGGIYRKHLAGRTGLPADEVVERLMAGILCS